MSNNTPETDHSPDAGKMVETPTAGPWNDTYNHLPERTAGMIPEEGDGARIIKAFRERNELKAAIEQKATDLDTAKGLIEEKESERVELEEQLIAAEAEVERLNSLLRAALDSREFNKQAADRLRAENAAMRTAVVHAYTQGYRSGHHDTVEGGYTDVHWTDEDTYFAEEAAEIITAALAKHAE